MSGLPNLIQLAVSTDTPRPRTAPSKDSAQTHHPPLPFELPRISIDTDVLDLRKALHLRPDDLTTSHDANTVPQHASSRLASVSSRSPRLRSPSLPSKQFSDRLAQPRLPAQRRPATSFRSNDIATSDVAQKAQNPAQLAQKESRQFPKSDRLRSVRNITVTARTVQRSQAKPPLLSPTAEPQLAVKRATMDSDRIPDTVSSGGEEEYYDATGQMSGSGQIGPDAETSGQSSSDDVFLKVANSPELKRVDDHNQLERKLVSTGIPSKPSILLRHRHRCQSLKCMALGTNRYQSRGRRQAYLHSPTLDSDGSLQRRNSSSHDSGYAARAEPSFAERRRPSASGASIYSAILPRNPAVVSSEQRLNAYRSKYMASTPQSPSLTSRPDSIANGYRRPSAPDAMYNRPQAYRPSRLHYSSNRDNDLSSQADTSSEFRRTSLKAESRADGGESVASNTIQSTMWDELNELKSRLQKIELGDKSQPTTFSSGGTMSNGSNERPRTATTTLTTMSSSPKVAKPGLSPTDGTIGGPAAANIHPLLHQSLARCKQTLPASLYRSLETAASDALEMAVLAGAPGSQSTMLSSASIINGAVTDRQLRRKADNVCRSLTDLCISLCEGKFDPATAGAQRPGSRGISSSFNNSPITPSIAYTRHTSLEPEPKSTARPTPSRALDRVEARRASLMSMTLSTNSSPRDSVPPTQFDSASPAVITPSLREIPKPTRIGTSLQRTRHRINGEDEDDDPAQRPISRATTDIGTSFRKRANRLSGGMLNSRGEREYTSQHPLPTIPSNPNLPKPTPLRRIGGTTFNKDESNSAPSSLNRERTQKFINRDGEPMYLTPDASTDDERKVRRRSLGLYSTARATLGLSRKSSLSKRSVVAGGD